MGHKRYGYLKKTKAWRLIVNELAGFAAGTSEISAITQKTLQEVQDRYGNLKNDPSITAGFEFLLHVSRVLTGCETNFNLLFSNDLV